MDLATGQLELRPTTAGTYKLAIIADLVHKGVIIQVRLADSTDLFVDPVPKLSFVYDIIYSGETTVNVPITIDVETVRNQPLNTTLRYTLSTLN